MSNAIPLKDVLIKAETCPDCDGRGFVETKINIPRDPLTSCARCKGQGVIVTAGHTVPEPAVGVGIAPAHVIPCSQEEYVAGLQRLALIAMSARGVPTAGMLAALNASESLGPILKPSEWINGGAERVRAVRDLVEALAAFKTAVDKWSHVTL